MTVAAVMGRQDRVKLRRRDRYHAREAMRGFTTLDRVRKCGRTPVGGAVALVRGGGTAGYSGLAVCGSTWSCPCCAAKIAEHRRQDLHALMLAHKAAGGGFGMMTLTMRHHAGEPLADLWDKLSLAWRKVQQHRAWRRDVRPALLGYVRVVETTHGVNGWHVHLHAVMFTKQPETDAWFAAMESQIVSRWASVLTGLGRSCVPSAQQFRRLTGDPSEALAEYFAKATLEVTRSDLKSGKFGGRTPFGILRGLVGLDDASADPSRDFGLWREWEAGSRGRRQFGYSHGLRAGLEAGLELSDEEAAVEVPGADGAVVLFENKAQWRAVRRAGLVCVLLEVAELGADLQAARVFVRARLRAEGLSWTEPPDVST